VLVRVVVVNDIYNYTNTNNGESCSWTHI